MSAIRNTIKSIILCSTLIVFSGCSPDRSKQEEVEEKRSQVGMEQERTISFQGGVLGNKPWSKEVSFLTGAAFNRAVFQQLLYFDSSYNIKPGIISDWNWEKKTQSYHLKLSSDARFDKDRKVKAIDVEFALIKSFLSLKTDSTQGFLNLIKGTEKLKKGQKFKTGMCEGIIILPNGDLKIILKEPSHLFLYALGDFLPPIAPIEDFEGDLHSFKGIPRGSGKYFVEWSDPNTSLVRLKLKEGYITNDRAPLVINFFNHGSARDNDVDMATGSGGDSIRKFRDIYETVYSSVPVAVSVLDFNYTNKYGKQKLFRKAVSLALNRDEIFKGYNSSKTNHELIPTKYYGRSRLKHEFSPEQSRQIIKEHFKSISSPRKPLKAIFHGSKGGAPGRYIKRIKKQLEDVGLYFDFVSREDITFRKEDSDFIISSYGLVTSFVDPVSPFIKYIEGKDSLRHSPKSDLVAENLYKRVLESRTLENRAKNLESLSRYFHNEYRQLVLEEIYPSLSFKKSKIGPIESKDIFFTIDFGGIEIK